MVSQRRQPLRSGERVFTLARTQPTSGWALQEANVWLVAGRATSTIWPGVRSTGAVGPSSVPFERWTSTLTPLSVAPVVFSTLPTNTLASESYERTSRAPARTSSKVSPSANWVPDSSSPSPDSEPPLCSPDSEPPPCSPDSAPSLCSPDSEPPPWQPASASSETTPTNIRIIEKRLKGHSLSQWRPR